MAAHPIPKIEYGIGPTVISFDYPPSEGNKKREEIEAVGKTSESLSGVRQVQRNYLEGSRKMKFKFLSEALMTSIETFYKDWASLGKSFKFFQDKTSINYVTYELDQKKLSPKETHGIDGDTYRYELELAFRRALSSVTGDTGYMQQEILNNQGVAVDFPDIIFDATEYKSVRMFFELSRKTDTQQNIVNGQLVATFNDLTNSWSIDPPSWEGSPSHGVTFSISAGGQLKYISDNLTGANYVGYILVRNFIIQNG